MINLLPSDRLLERRLAKSNTQLRLYLIIAIAGAFLVIAALFVAEKFLLSHRQDVESQLIINQSKAKELAPVQEDAKKLSLTINTISGLFGDEVRFSDLFTEVGGLTPSGTVLTGLQLSVDSLDAPLTITALTQDESRAIVLRENLEKSDLFKSAEIKSISRNETAANSSTPESPDTNSSTNNNDTNNSTDQTEGQDLTSKYGFTVIIDAVFDKGATNASSKN